MNPKTLNMFVMENRKKKKKEKKKFKIKQTLQNKHKPRKYKQQFWRW